MNARARRRETGSRRVAFIIEMKGLSFTHFAYNGDRVKSNVKKLCQMCFYGFTCKLYVYRAVVTRMCMADRYRHVISTFVAARLYSYGKTNRENETYRRDLLSNG